MSREQVVITDTPFVGGAVADRPLQAGTAYGLPRPPANSNQRHQYAASEEHGQ